MTDIVAIPKEALKNIEVLGNIFTVLGKIERIASDDFCADIEWDLMKDKLTTEKEKIMAEKLGRIYMFSHAFSPTCGKNHPDWRAEALKEITPE